MADPSGANLKFADLRRASLRGAKLQGADLSFVEFQGAALTYALGLTHEQLDWACGDETTRLPARLTLEACPE